MTARRFYGAFWRRSAAYLHPVVRAEDPTSRIASVIARTKDRVPLPA